MKVKGKLPRARRKLTVWIENVETEEYGGDAQSTIYMKIFLDNTVQGRSSCVETYSLSVATGIQSLGRSCVQEQLLKMELSRQDR